jgi:hypothetical protein
MLFKISQNSCRISNFSNSALLQVKLLRPTPTTTTRLPNRRNPQDTIRFVAPCQQIILMATQLILGIILTVILVRFHIVLRHLTPAIHHTINILPLCTQVPMEGNMAVLVHQLDMLTMRRFSSTSLGRNPFHLDTVRLNHRVAHYKIHAISAGLLRLNLASLEKLQSARESHQ